MVKAKAGMRLDAEGFALLQCIGDRGTHSQIFTTFPTARHGCQLPTIAIGVSVSLSVRSYVSQTTCPYFTEFSTPATFDGRQCSTFSTSGFVNDVIFHTIDPLDHIQIKTDKDNDSYKFPMYSPRQHRGRNCYFQLLCSFLCILPIHFRRESFD